MVIRKAGLNPTAMFWNCLGLAIAIMSIGTSWSISRAKVYQLQLAQYKLAVGDALSEVKHVSDQLEQKTQSLPLPVAQKRKIQRQLQETNAVIESAETAIDQEVKELTQPEDKDEKHNQDIQSKIQNLYP